MREPQQSPWMTIAECAAYVRVRSERAVRRLTEEHGLPYHRAGARYRFHRAEVDAWLLRSGSGQAQAACDSRAAYAVV